MEYNSLRSHFRRYRLAITVGIIACCCPANLRAQAAVDATLVGGARNDSTERRSLFPVVNMVIGGLQYGESVTNPGLKDEAELHLERRAVANTPAAQRHTFVPVVGVALIGGLLGAGAANVTGLNDHVAEAGALLYGLGAGIGASVGAKAVGLSPAWAETIGASIAASIPLALAVGRSRGSTPTMDDGFGLIVATILPPLAGWIINKISQ